MEKAWRIAGLIGRKVQLRLNEANAFSTKLNYKKMWSEKSVAAKIMKIFNARELQPHFCETDVSRSYYFFSHFFK